MADVNVAAIQGNPPPVIPALNPLQVLSGWQDLANKRAQLELTQQATANAAQQHEQVGYNMAQQQTVHMASQFAGLLAQPNITQDDVENLVKYAQQRGALSPDQVITTLAEMPKGASDGVYRQYLTQKLVNGLSAADAAGRTLPGRMAQDTGQGTQLYTVGGPNAGQNPNVPVPAGGLMPGGAPSNASLTETMPVVDNNRFLADGVTPNPNFGSTSNVVRGAIVPPALMRPGSPLGGNGLQTTPAFPPGVRPAPAGNGTGPAGPAASAAPGGPVIGGGTGAAPSSLPPGTAESVTAEKGASTAQGIQLTNTDQSRPQKQALLDDILIQSRVPGAFTGPDSPAFRTMMARLGQIPGVIDDKVRAATGAQEQMAKAMANLQTIQMDAMIPTNAGLAHTIDASPHMELSKVGLEGIVHQLQGTFDAQGAMSNAWQRSGLPPESFKAWQNKFISPTPNGQFDPRVFWLARMSQAERETFVKAANDPNLKKNYNFAVQQGWVSR